MVFYSRQSILRTPAFRILPLVLLVSGCITSSEKKGMHDDIYNVQTRLLVLEHQLGDTSKKAETSGESANKRLASTQANLDRIDRQLRELHGDVDALRIGVVTGQMPGSDASQQEGSVAASLTKLNERMDAVEQAQEELVEALKKAGLKRKDAKNTKTHKTSSVSDVDGLQKEFDDKHYKQVVDDAPHLIKANKGHAREQASYLLAESYFKLGKIREAALHFNDLVESKPSKKVLPLAKMRLGDCFRHLGDASTAKVYYEELIKEFPRSDEAAKAKERLAGFDKGGHAKG